MASDDNSLPPSFGAAHVGLVAGPLAFALISLAPAPDGMPAEAWRVAAVAAFMAVWWLSEAVPIAVTALIPMALFPLLDLGSIKSVTAPYANPLIFLFLGGFLIALAVERWGLHRRIALAVLSRAGTRPQALVGAFMLTAGFLSAWISNTAATVMMLPIALSVIAIVKSDTHEDGDDAFAKALLIGTAYGASIGGLATLVGTPPNALLAAFVLDQYGIEIGFARWMMIGVPVSVVMGVLAWLILGRIVFALSREPIVGAAEHIAAAHADLGAMSRAEKLTAAVFICTALLWMTRPLIGAALPGLNLSDSGIAIAAGVVLFVLPVNFRQRQFVMDWDTAKRLPWGILILFGGGLSLASQVSASGLAGWIGAALSDFGQWPLLAVVALVAGVIVFLTELTSNTATTATFLPVFAALAASMGVAPLNLLIPAAMAASMAFMMPVATPPNAVVFAGGHLTIPDMARAGFLVNLTAIAVITCAMWLIAGFVFAEISV